MKRIVFAAAAAVALLVAGPASAHTALVSSNIEAGRTYAEAPRAIELVFSAAVGLAEAKLALEGKEVPIDYAYPDEMRTDFRIPLPELASGRYTFAWRVMSKDGHAMTGELAFAVK